MFKAIRTTYDTLQLPEIKNIRLLRMRPPQERREVRQRLWQHALLVSEGRQVDIGVSFAEFLAHLIDEEGDMAEAWRRPVEGIIQCDMHGSRGHPFLCLSAWLSRLG